MPTAGPTDGGSDAASAVESEITGTPTTEPQGLGGELRHLRRHTFVYGAGIVLNRLAGFIMLPVYTRFLSPADYGVLELLSMTIEIIGTIAGMGLLAGVFKLYADQGTEAEKNRLLSTALLGSAGIALLTCIAGILAAPLLNRVVLGADGRPVYFVLFFLIYLFQAIGVVPGQMIRLLERSGMWISLNLAKLVLQLSLNIYFVVVLELGVMGVLLGNLLSVAAMSLGTCLWALRRTGLEFSRKVVRTLTGYGNPMVVWSLSNFLLVFSDRFFLQHYTDTASVGIYALAYKFAFLLSSFAFTPFMAIWQTRRFVIAKQANAGYVFSRVFVYMNVALGSGALLIALFIRDIISVMAAPDFLPSYQFVPLLLLSQIVFHWVSYCNVGVLVTGKTGAMAEIGILGAAATIAANFLLIPTLGILGATFATLIAYCVRFIFIYVRAQRAYPVPYEWLPIIKLLGIYGGAVALRFMLPHGGILLSLGVSTLLAVIALAVAYGTVLTGSERLYLRGVVGRSRLAVALRGA